MNRILLSFWCLLCAVSVAMPAHVAFDLADFMTSNISKRQVTMTPQSTPRTNGTSVITSDAIKFVTDTNGQYTVSNVVDGVYEIAVRGPATTTIFWINVPDSNATLNAYQLLTTTNSVPSEVVGYTISQADGRFVLRNSGWASNLVVTNLISRGSTNVLQHTNGSSGYFLRTDGTNAFWASVAQGGGEANTGENVGGGVNVYGGMNGTALRISTFNSNQFASNANVISFLSGGVLTNLQAWGGLDIQGTDKITQTNITGSALAYWNGNSELVSVTGIDSTEATYLDGVTSYLMGTNELFPLIAAGSGNSLTNLTPINFTNRSGTYWLKQDAIAFRDYDFYDDWNRPNTAPGGVVTNNPVRYKATVTGPTITDVVTNYGHISNGVFRTEIMPATGTNGSIYYKVEMPNVPTIVGGRLVQYDGNGGSQLSSATINVSSGSDYVTKMAHFRVDRDGAVLSITTTGVGNFINVAVISPPQGFTNGQSSTMGMAYIGNDTISIWAHGTNLVVHHASFSDIWGKYVYYQIGGAITNLATDMGWDAIWAGPSHSKLYEFDANQFTISGNTGAAQAEDSPPTVSINADLIGNATALTTPAADDAFLIYDADELALKQITLTNIPAVKIGSAPIRIGTVSDGQILKYVASGTYWTNLADSTGAGGGDAISVNGTGLTDADLDDATPAPASGFANILWQQDGGSPANVSGYFPHNTNTIMWTRGGLSSNLNVYIASFYTNLTVDYVTASRAAVFDANKVLTNSAVTAIELGYLTGVTAAVQTQFDAKMRGATNNNQFAASTTLTIKDTPLITNLWDHGTITASNLIVLSNAQIHALIATNIQVHGSGAGLVDLYDAAGDNYLRLIPTNMASDVVMIVSPAAAPSDDQVLAYEATGNYWTNKTLTGGSGDSITVGGVAVTDADFDGATPSAPAGYVNVTWQQDGGSPANISAYWPILTNAFAFTNNSIFHTLFMTNATADRVSYFDSSKRLVADANVSSTELGYLDGVTSAIQTQIGGKQDSDAGLTSISALSSAGYVRSTAADTYAIGTTSANLASDISDETGTGALTYNTQPLLISATVSNNFGYVMSTNVGGLTASNMLVINASNDNHVKIRMTNNAFFVHATNGQDSKANFITYKLFAGLTNRHVSFQTNNMVLLGTNHFYIPSNHFAWISIAVDGATIDTTGRSNVVVGYKVEE